MSADVRFTRHPFDALDPQALHDLLRLRVDVFVGEQGITVDPEIDGFDPACEHVVGRTADGRVVATARLRPHEGVVKVERVTVHPEARGAGVGTRLMDYVHDCLAGRSAVLSAQAHLEAWYVSLGWARERGPYDEAGIPHVWMTRKG